MFRWRGREGGEDVMTFGDENVMSITFFGDGSIKGVIEGSFVGEAPFTGFYAHRENYVWRMHIQQWKREWRGINQWSYDAESSARWGGWSANEGRLERPEDSDTSAGTGGADSDEGEYDDEGDYNMQSGDIYF
jgi:hypothetical protein